MEFRMRAVLSTFFVSLICACGSGSGGPGEGMEMPITVRVDTLESATLTVWAESFARVEAERQALVYGTGGSTVEALLVEQGDTVSNGQLLAILDTDAVAEAGTSQAYASMSSARASYDTAKDYFERINLLYEAGARSQQELISAENALRSAESSLRYAQASLQAEAGRTGNSMVTAPFDGIVGRIWAREGNTIDGNPVLSLTSGSPIVWIMLPETDAGRIEEGREALITVSGRDSSLSGTVSSVSPTIDPTTGLVSVKIEIDDPEHDLIPGMAVRVRVCTEVMDNILAVPSTALIPTSTGYSVALVEEGTASVAPVETGSWNGTMVQVTSGLSAGDHVIVQGGYMVVDGSPIVIEGQELPAGMPEGMR
ncbi:MAG: efflux RND transporter periplasmic adaptor subunit [Sphaerochaetaceae bacterium]|nr:efflux RND transporter periplasmic adaptor subunit [Sphaerochaetaceae bacterium]